MPGLGAVLQQGREQLSEAAPDEGVLVARLRAAGCVFAEDEARVLLSSTSDAVELEDRVRRREAGEPFEVVVGWAEFCGLRIAVDPGVFVPRQRSAFLVEVAAAGLPVDAGDEPDGRPLVLDLCCGTGALGLAVAHRRRIRLVGADSDPAAVPCARRNLDGVGEVFGGDLFAALPASIGLRGRIAVILANAPYVPTGEIALMPPEARLHEPRSALDGGADGLTIHRRIAAEAPGWLAPGGRLLIEVAERQVDAALSLLRDGGLRPQVETDDERGAVVVVGTRI